MRPTQRPSTIRLLSALGGLLLVVAACSSSGASASAPAAQPSAAASAAGSAAAGGEEYVIAAATDAKLGGFLTGEDGKTLYIFTPDSANTSTCVDACATELAAARRRLGRDTLKAGDGVTGKLTTFARPDGTMQVAYNGIPLYYFAKDAKAGDVNGQGVGGKWFVASADAARCRRPAPQSAPTDPLPHRNGPRAARAVRFGSRISRPASARPGTRGRPRGCRPSPTGCRPGASPTAPS